MKRNPIYFDYAAATPLDPKVITIMQPYYEECFQNPSAIYSSARQAKKALEKARHQVAKNLGVKSGEIIFTSGATEANNLAINGVMQLHQNQKLVSSSIEHDSILELAHSYGARMAPVDEKGVINLAKLSKLIDDKVVLVTVMMVNNEIGSLQPIREIAELIRKERERRLEKGKSNPIYLHTDATQAMNFFNVSPHHLGVDLLTFNAGKIYGPKGIGVLFVRAGVKLKPQILGGGQEMGVRSGTENVSLAAGLSEALKITINLRNQEKKRLSLLRDKLINMVEIDLPEAKLNGPKKHRNPNNVNISFNGLDAETLLFQLDEMGVEVSTGSACSASKGDVSKTLKAIGLDDSQINSSLRITLGRQTSEDDINYLLECLKKVYKKT